MCLVTTIFNCLHEYFLIIYWLYHSDVPRIVALVEVEVEVRLLQTIPIHHHKIK